MVIHGVMEEIASFGQVRLVGESRTQGGFVIAIAGDQIERRRQRSQ